MPFGQCGQCWLKAYTSCSFMFYLLAVFGVHFVLGSGSLWSSQRKFELRVYVSHQYNFFEFYDKNALVWYTRDLSFGWSVSNERSESINIPVSQFPNFLKNISVYSHIFFSEEGKHPDPKNPYYDELTLYTRHELTQWVYEKTKPKKTNLLTGLSTQSLEEQDAVESHGLDFVSTCIPTRLKDDRPDTVSHECSQHGLTATLRRETSHQIVRYWKPELTLHLVVDIPSEMTRKRAPQNIRDLGLTFHSSGKFYPPIYVDEFWSMSSNFVAMNKSIVHLPMSVSYSGISHVKWTMQASMERSWQQQRKWGAQTHAQQDELKRILMDTNPYLLILTAIVTVLHTIFDCLAFKNDIQFWRERASLKGLSTKSMIIGIVFRLIIVLYLYDNEITRVILFSQVAGLLIELWKFSKTIKFTVTHDKNRLLPSVRIEDHEIQDPETEEYDALAMRHLSEIIYPLIFGCAMYSLVYAEHKNMYSWILSTAVGFIYAAGFILMTPQLFINYKLKSVAHLPWRKMVYKCLSTIIDDLFAFVVEMPTLHRFACFRDDAIFCIFCYQKYIYSVDLSRANEYGLTGEQERELEQTRSG